MHPIHKLFEKAVRIFFDNMAAGQTRFKRGAFGVDLLCKSAFGLTSVFGWEGDRQKDFAEQNDLNLKWFQEMANVTEVYITALNVAKAAYTALDMVQ